MTTFLSFNYQARRRIEEQGWERQSHGVYGPRTDAAVPTTSNPPQVLFLRGRLDGLTTHGSHFLFFFL